MGYKVIAVCFIFLVVVIEETPKSYLPQGIKNTNSFSMADEGCGMLTEL